MHMETMEDYAEEAYETLKSPQSSKGDYACIFEKLAMQYSEIITLARHDLIPFPTQKIIRIMVLLDFLRMKLSN